MVYNSWVCDDFDRLKGLEMDKFGCVSKFHSILKMKMLAYVIIIIIKVLKFFDKIVKGMEMI